MPVTETDRLHLLDAARRTWDDGAATTLMNLLPNDADKLATKDDLKADLALLEARLRTEMANRFNEQTRTIMLANTGMWLSVAGLMVALRFT